MSKQATENIRDRARKYFKRLLIKHRHKCHWCGDMVVRIKDIKDNIIVNQTSRTVTYLNSKGKRIKRRIATIDHVIPIVDNGTSDWDNLVIACVTCNGKRNKEDIKRKNYVRRNMV